MWLFKCSSRPQIRARTVETVKYGALLESVVHAAGGTARQVELGVETPSLPSPDDFIPLRSCSPALTYLASPIPPDHVEVRNENVLDDEVVDHPKLTKFMRRPAVVDSTPRFLGYPYR